MKTVAISGFASNSREAVRKSQADEIWSLNMLHSSPVMRNIFPLNIHRMFEIHPLWMLKKDWYSISTDHWGWMTRVKHHYPVYMIEPHPEVHNSVRYPLEEVCAHFLGSIRKGGDPVRYFTSSFCYMVALALLEGFERIEVYGFDMGSETEYVYQKAAGEFWLGIASQHAEVYLPPPSTLLTARLYGFEAGQLVHPDRIQAYRDHYTEVYDAQTLDMSIKANAVGAQMALGAISLADQLLEQGDLMSRQVLEGYKAKFQTRAHKAQQQFNTLNERIRERRRGNGDIANVEQDAGRAVVMMYRADGAYQLAKKLIAECDLQAPGFELVDRYSVVDVSPVKV